MRFVPDGFWKQLAAGVAAIIGFNLAVYSVVAVETCSVRNCVSFQQWRFASGSTLNYREAAGLECWSYLDACCHPLVTPEWCSNYLSLMDMGESTRKVMDYGTEQCTSASCSSEKAQLATGNMTVEFANATRYFCYDANEE